MAKKKAHDSWQIHEVERINELRFRHLMLKFFGKDSNPEKMYQFVEMLGYLFNLNQERLKSAALETIHDTYPGIKREIVMAMLYKKVPVLQICKTLHISPPTYYEYIELWRMGDFEMYPKYNKNQTKELIKLMAKLDILLDMTT